MTTASRTGRRWTERRSSSGLGAYVQHIDDGSATSSDQVRHSQAGAANGCKHLEVKVGDPVVVGDLIDPPSGALARVVHQAVEAAPPGDGRINKSFKVSRASDIGLRYSASPPASRSRCPAAASRSENPARRPRPGPLLDEAIRKRRSQPVGPASDKHDPAIQVQIH